MARSHSLTVWTLVLGFLAAASLYAAEPKDKPAQTTETTRLQTMGKSLKALLRVEKAPAKPSPKKPPQPAVRYRRPAENVKAIEDALNGPTEMGFVEAPLQDVVDYLKTQHAIEIKIDNKALQDVGIDASSPITVSLKGISLRSALNLMLKELSLTWIIQHEVLMITTPEESDNQLSTKVYDVADLVVCRDDRDAIWDDYDALVEIITSTVKPTTWSETGGPGDIRGNALGTAKVLVISQTQDVHEEIADLLKNIREIAKKNPHAGTPRRNKPVSPAPRRRAADIGGLHNPPVYADPLGVPKQKSPSNAAPKQEKQPKPEAPKSHGGMGAF